MKQYVHNFSTHEELVSWLQSIETNNISSILVQIFTGILDQSELLQDIIKATTKELPLTTVIGTSTAGEILNQNMLDNSIVISVSVFFSTMLKSSSYISNDSFMLGEKMSEKIITPKTKAVIMFADGLQCNGDELLRGFSSKLTNKDVVIAGGLAGDNNTFEQTFVIHGEEIFSGGVVAVALEGEELIVHNSYNLSWKPIGLPMKITRAQGNKIFEIDNKPVTEVYREYLGDGIVENMPDSAIEFPLVFEYKGISVARSMIAVEDDYVMYAGDIPQGEKVRFGVASPKMLQTSRNEMYLLNAQLPVESLYVYSCVARKAFLGKELEYELRPLADIATLSGFYTYGELYTAHSDHKMLNITTTVLALCEGEKKEYKISKEVLDEARVSLSTNALIHLVDKTVSTLEQESSLKENTIAQLKQYKKAIHKSYILSVADLKGIIIDVNERFIDVSGYSRDELIGKPHNIVRHPEVPSEVFAEMWGTIKAKRIWQGALKNLRKNGTTYYVNATVFPLLDRDDNITSYISIRDDITEIKAQQDRAEAILNAQNSIVLLSSKQNNTFYVKQLNEKFFELFDYKNTEDFLQHYSCICDLFIPQNGYLAKEMDGKSWLNYALEHKENTNLVLMRDKFGNTHIFSLRSQNINLENEEFVISTFTDVTELETARLQAQAAEKTKSAFLSTMSHELRTPLNAVIGFSQILMRKTDMSQEQMHSFIEKINISGTHLINLVNNILDFSKIESENVNLQKEQSSIYSLIHNTVTILETSIAKKKLRLHYEGFENVKMIVDEQLIKQLFLNLLSNAIKFTPDEKNIFISYLEDSHFHIIKVCDEGVGIPKEQLEEIFNPFSQVKEHQNESIKGTGLGLAISKKIVELHNGKFEVESLVAEGTCFKAYLPK